MSVRRIVTGHTPGGQSTILSDGLAPRRIALDAFPSFRGALVWSTSAQPPDCGAGLPDSTPHEASFVPAPGETRFHLMHFPPDAELFGPGVDVEAVVRQQHEQMPGLAETFEPTGMHLTPTLDYAVVVSGEIWLELDDGEETLVRAGDVVVQQGTRHAWRNRSKADVTMVFVMVGAAR
jgi:quercetin dioxygenase-like cupin family protein